MSTTITQIELDAALSALEFSKHNLLRNSGFTGNYLPAILDPQSTLADTSQMYSPSFQYWQPENASIQESTVSDSGKEVVLMAGSLTQELFYRMQPGERYIFSFRGKGTSLTFSCGGYIQTVALDNTYRRYVCKFTTPTVGDVTLFALSEVTATLCELQLERGTVPSAWGASMMDFTAKLAYIRSLEYIADALGNNDSDPYPGLAVTSQIQLGNYGDGAMSQVTSGLSGLYNSANDIAFWAGADYAGALAGDADFTVTHGGKATLKNADVRGYVHATDGIYQGEVNIGGHKILLSKTGSGHLGDGSISWNDRGNAVYRGLTAAPYLTLDGHWDNAGGNRQVFSFGDAYSTPTNNYIVELSPSADQCVLTLPPVDPFAGATFRIYVKSQNTVKRLTFSGNLLNEENPFSITPGTLFELDCINSGNGLLGYYVTVK